MGSVPIDSYILMLWPSKALQHCFIVYLLIGFVMQGLLNPAPNLFFVSIPFFAELLCELALFAPNKEVSGKDANEGDEDAAERTQEDRRPEEHKNIASQIQRISRKSVRTIGNKSALRLQGDYFHMVGVEKVRRPHANAKSDKEQHGADAH